MSKLIRNAIAAIVLFNCFCATAGAATAGQTVEQLQRDFQRQLRSYLLTSPAENNAELTLKRLKTLQPKHELVSNGPLLIAERYVMLAKKSAAKKRPEQTSLYLNKALRFNPKNKAALDMRAQIDAKQYERFSQLGHNIVAIKGGCFEMGSPESEKGRNAGERLHEVCVNDFGLAKYEVTMAEFDRFSTANSQSKVADKGWGRGKRPAVGISWQQAHDYTVWLSEITGQRFRLPTEAEWEYAARAGSTSAFYTGKKMSKRQNNVNADNDNYSPRGKTQPVGKYKPNAWGLYDMHGNVWEWTCSVYAANYEGKQEQQCQPDANDNARILRGGSWYSRPDQSRAAYRSTALYSDKNRGFRLLQEVPSR